MELSTPIEELPRVGPAYQKRLKRLGIKNVKQLLFYFPHKYEDFSNIAPISHLKVGGNFCVQGKIIEIKHSRTWKKGIFLTEAVIQDKSGVVKAVWFNQSYLANVLKNDAMVCLAGKLMLGDSGAYLSNPAYEKIPNPRFRIQDTELTHTGRIVPVYPETEGLSSRWLRWILRPLLIRFKDKIPETLPEKIVKEHGLAPINSALQQVHFPESLEFAEAAKQRFAFEELFNISLFVLKERAKLARAKAPVIGFDLPLIKKFVASLPFKLTSAQKKSAWQILKDLARGRPMNRLLEGDVGSGKTVVAVMAALLAARAGWQVGFMAPTEILAKQHFKEASSLLQGFGLNIGLLTGKQDRFISKKLPKEIIEISRKKLLEKARGEIGPVKNKIYNGVDILIGTHALIQDKVKFGKLGLVILDEQHRFGVEQRARLVRNSSERLHGPDRVTVPHLLSMTATPIPRTLALTIYGDLDLSLIDELPKGRKKIVSKIVAADNRQKAYEFIKGQIKKGRQVFVICPRIEKNQKSKIKNQNDKSKFKNKRDTNIWSWAEVKAVEEEYEKLSKEVFPDLKIAMLHGRLSVKEKERIMTAFKNKKFDILVSTSVVEVGIDVPNAAVIMIEGAERFGLAQLHQFRGRVGRSEHQSFCFLLTTSPVSKTNQRLNALLACDNGFELAEKDLQIRGPGDFAGTRQWGLPDLAMSSLKDIKLVEKTREAAKEILTEDPGLKKYSLLAKKLEDFAERAHLE